MFYLVFVKQTLFVLDFKNFPGKCKSRNTGPICFETSNSICFATHSIQTWTQINVSFETALERLALLNAIHWKYSQQ